MDAERRNVPTHTPWEPIVGYSRAVRVGSFVHVSGTAPVDDTGKVVAPGNPHAQALRALNIIEAALKEAGAALSDVVRTRIYLNNIDHWEEVGRAHGEVLRDIRPATTIVQVSRFVDPEMLVEIEADAIIASSAGGDAAR
jgi:enamine deaminase RidA (YjgF/YER057c/UK114 family)